MSLFVTLSGWLVCAFFIHLSQKSEMMKKKENCRAPGNKILDELFHLPEVFMLIFGEFTLCAGIGNWGGGGE